MNSRIEQKLEITRSDYPQILCWLKSKGAIMLHPPRLVYSRYFDTHDFRMYWDTQEGLIPRKKIRIRTYNTSNFFDLESNYQLEIKSTDYHQRYKTINKVNEIQTLIKNGIFDKQYGLCHQKVDITYLREYYFIENCRVTIDKDIQYKLISTNTRKTKDNFLDKTYVLEIKSDIGTSKTFLANTFNFHRTRFSKYERSIYNLLI